VDRYHLKRRQKKAFKHFLNQLLLVIFAAAVFIPSFFYLFHRSKPSEAETKIGTHHFSRKSPVIKNTASPQVNDVNNDPAIDQYLKSLNFNGTALVVKDNKVIMNKGYGYADFEGKLENNASTVYYIGSITKVFISTAVMQLQEKGKLHINDPLSLYIPDYPNGHQIKLYHLLTHSSGIPEHTESADTISHDQLIKKIAKGPLKFQPGTNWNYSDSNYAILGYIVEKQTGEPLEQYVKKNIFIPAGLKHTGFGTSFYTQSYPSKGYKLKNNQMISPSLPNMSQLFGSGDIYTTAYDMYLFDKALYSGKLLNQESLKQFFTPFKHNYALGLYSDPGSYSDHGVLPGWNTLNSFSKNGSKYVVLFSNVQNGVRSLGVVNNQIYMMMLRNL
jgi:CubicO group peptidase (beta-lactamase class C family)